MPEITKSFRFEAAHRVPDADSELCRSSIHGHSYVVEITLSSNFLNMSDMVLDFIHLQPIKELCAKLDHSLFVSCKDNTDYSATVRFFSDRLVVMEENVTAEQMASAFFNFAEVNVATSIVKVKAVTVYETVNSKATFTRKDAKRWRKAKKPLAHFIIDHV